MTPGVALITNILSLGTVLLDVSIVVFVILIFTQNPLKSFLARNALLISFLLAASGVLASLFYSNIAHFPPCLLCWWQRIFLYPAALILGMAWWKKDERVADYILPLSGLGILTAAYNVFLQFGGEKYAPCAASGVSCAQRYFLEYGYVTIPTMALTVFVAIFLLMLLHKIYNHAD